MNIIKSVFPHADNRFVGFWLVCKRLGGLRCAYLVGECPTTN